MTYRAVPITQRDGSALANSNCRMASIATGLDYQTGGAKTSTGSKMRASQPDQSGGTDSGDAAKAWASYEEDLDVEDGKTWADAVAALKAGYLIHLDVWHATCGGPCLSGSGAYGHTIAVAPEANGTRWLVADPWCNPPKWTWWEASALEAGANRWGSEVYSRAGREEEWATAGPNLRRIILQRIVRALMTQWHPGVPAPHDLPPETGGGGQILYTRTSKKGGDDMRFVSASGYNDTSDLRVNVGEGAPWYYLDGTKGGEFSGDAALRSFGLPDAGGGAYVVLIKTGAPYADKVARDTLVMIKTSNDVYPAVPPDINTDPACEEAIHNRDEEWLEWLTAGAPGQDEGG